MKKCFICKKWISEKELLEHRKLDNDFRNFRKEFQMEFEDLSHVSYWYLWYECDHYFPSKERNPYVDNILNWFSRRFSDILHFTYWNYLSNWDWFGAKPSWFILNLCEFLYEL